MNPSPSTLLFIRRMFSYLPSYRWQTATIAALPMLESTFGALIPLSLMFLIDRALVQRDRHSLFLTILFLGGAGLTISAAGLVRDVALLKNSPRTATVQAIKPSLCVSLSRQTFMAIIGKYRQVCRQVTEVAHARLAKLGGSW